MIKPHDPVYPRDAQSKTPCLTKREYFAAAAMRGLLASGGDALIIKEADLADCAVNYADALIEALKRQEYYDGLL